MSVRCLLFGHDVGSPVKRNGVVRWRCARCDRLSPPIDTPTLPAPAPVIVVRESKDVLRLVKRA